jgi:hypothetical protein
VANRSLMTRPSRKGFERVVEHTLGLQHVADIFVGYRQIALPKQIAGIGRRQPFADDQAIAKKV